jgi:hypothetical protein
MVYLRFVVIVLIASACVPAAEPPFVSLQVLPIDTRAIATAAAAEFRAATSPIIEISSGLECPRESCPHVGTEDFLRREAAVLGVRLVAHEDPLPPCPWNATALIQERGLRLLVSPPRPRGDVMSVAVAGRCANRPGTGHPYYELVHVYEISRDTGSWRVVRLLVSFVT